MTTNLRFPPAIDNSMRKELVKCQKIAHWKFEKGLNEPGVSPDLHAGGAFAAGCEAVRKAFYLGQKSDADALNAGIEALHKAYGDFVPPAPKKYKTAKTAERMAGALAYYFGERPLSTETLVPILLGKELGVEISFNEEIPIDHPDTRLPLTYCGRFDMLAVDDDKKVWVVDEKTTGDMGEGWLNQWNLDSALTGYCWGARKLLDSHGIDLPVAGAIINGVAIRALSNALPYETRQVNTYRQPWEVERWYKQMLKDVAAWANAYRMQDHNMVLDHACALYNNPCQYAKLCKSANPEQMESSYEVRFWNPLTREQEKA